MSKVINTLIYKDYEKNMYENKKANVVILDHYDDDLNSLWIEYCIFTCVYLYFTYGVVAFIST